MNDSNAKVRKMTFAEQKAAMKTPMAGPFAPLREADDPYPVADMSYVKARRRANISLAIKELAQMREVARHNWGVNIWGDEEGKAEDAAWSSMAAGCDSVAKSLGFDRETR